MYAFLYNQGLSYKDQLQSMYLYPNKKPRFMLGFWLTDIENGSIVVAIMRKAFAYKSRI